MPSRSPRLAQDGRATRTGKTILIRAAKEFRRFLFLTLGDMETVLRVRNVTKAYQALRAVNGISFEVHAGEIVGLLGPNGAGKTTTISMILGILAPSSGRIEVLGKEIPKEKAVPPAYAFEGMRELLVAGSVSISNLVWGLLSAVGYVILTYLFFVYIYEYVLKTGLLTRFSAENG